MDVAAVPKSLVVGRFRGRNVRVDFVGVLVHGDDPRYCDVPRQEQDSIPASSVQFALLGMDWFFPALDGLRKGLHIVGCIGCTTGSLSAHGR